MHDVLKDRYCQLMKRMGLPLYNPDDDQSYSGPIWNGLVAAYELGKEEGAGGEARRFSVA